MDPVPEGDTVWLASKRMNDALAGRVLTTFDLRVPRHATADLTGRPVLAVLARGKHMLTRVDGGLTLHTHFRMDGRWQLVRAGERWRGGPAHQVRAVLANSVWQAVGYLLHDVRLLRTSDEREVVGHLGPDLLGPDWDPAEAVRRLAAQPDREIGQALLDQRLLAGIGNLYKAETLFLSGVSPFDPVGAVGDLGRIVGRAHRLLLANRDHPEQSTTGSLRRGESHWVYGRARQPCRRCGTTVERRDQGERITFWCPHCQPTATQPPDRPNPGENRDPGLSIRPGAARHPHATNPADAADPESQEA
ncbi:MAG: endonuclease [Mycobacteriales bacterium]|jgi:endonuclease-8